MSSREVFAQKLFSICKFSSSFVKHLSRLHVGEREALVCIYLSALGILGKQGNFERLGLNYAVLFRSEDDQLVIQTRVDVFNLCLCYVIDGGLFKYDEVCKR